MSGNFGVPASKGWGVLSTLPAGAQRTDAAVKGAVTGATTARSVPSEDLGSGSLGLVGRTQKVWGQTRGKGPGEPIWEGQKLGVGGGGL